MGVALVRTVPYGQPCDHFKEETWFHSDISEVVLKNIRHIINLLRQIRTDKMVAEIFAQTTPI